MHPDFRVRDGRFAAMLRTIGVRKGKDAANAYLRGFVTGLRRRIVSQSIEANQAEGPCGPG